ncbi:cucumber peeling cupredoxin-like [Mercurialis annua]|uniref:cucumber peeling cupredoxin-like n=1 Tax=Mercurialis annua TaxID=3986 RepID=UPI0021606E8D|nr:cucumber peeling cupredoxin-like [Mercurialis annua]
MARTSSMVILAAVFVAALFHSSAAQATTHVVAGTTGWTIPSGDAALYSNWAAGQTFSVGDILVFNFANNAHDVTKVTKADYDACTSTAPISQATTTPARITINAAGEHYFLCSFPGHCGAGQKLMINVSAAATPAPPPSTPAPPPRSTTPTPVSAPTPAPRTPVAAPTPAPRTPVSAPTPAPRTPFSAPAPGPVSTPAPTGTATPPATSTSPSSPTTPSTPSPAGTTGPPPDSSAKQLGVAGVSATLLSIVVAFLY